MAATRSKVVIGMLMAAGLAISMAGCSAREAAVTPHEARDTLVKVIHDTSAMLDVDGWNRDSAPDIQGCDAPFNTSGAKYGYGYGAPQPGNDHLADAKTVADYWESLGMTVRIDTSHDPVVFATGGPLQGVSFSTAPGNYYISGTSLCVPGDADQLAKEEYVP